MPGKFLSAAKRLLVGEPLTSVQVSIDVDASGRSTYNGGAMTIAVDPGDTFRDLRLKVRRFECDIRTTWMPSRVFSVTNRNYFHANV